jgi:hypothetical protein
LPLRHSGWRVADRGARVARTTLFQTRSNPDIS